MDSECNEDVILMLFERSTLTGLRPLYTIEVELSKNGAFSWAGNLLLMLVHSNPLLHSSFQLESLNFLPGLQRLDGTSDSLLGNDYNNLSV